MLRLESPGFLSLSDNGDLSMLPGDRTGRFQEVSEDFDGISYLLG